MINTNALIVVCLLVVLDVISGLLKGYKHKNISSTKMREGMVNKITYFLVIAFTIVLDYGQSYLNLGFNIPLTNAVCIFICLTECVSFLENVQDLNPSLKDNKFMSIFKINSNNDSANKGDESNESK